MLAWGRQNNRFLWRQNLAFVADFPRLLQGLSCVRATAPSSTSPCFFPNSAHQATNKTLRRAVQVFTDGEMRTATDGRRQVSGSNIIPTLESSSVSTITSNGILLIHWPSVARVSPPSPGILARDLTFARLCTCPLFRPCPISLPFHDRTPKSKLVGKDGRIELPCTPSRTAPSTNTSVVRQRNIDTTVSTLPVICTENARCMGGSSSRSKQ